MYCPQCASFNSDNVKFCRSCGINLNPVVIALRDQSSSLTNLSRTDSHISANYDRWLERKSKALRDISQGAILMTVALLLALLSAVVSPGDFPWFIFWSVFFGWMACWGTVSLALGVGRIIESRVMLNERGNLDAKPESRSVIPGNSSFNTGNASEILRPVSAVENTTEPITNRLETEEKS